MLGRLLSVRITDYVRLKGQQNLKNMDLLRLLTT
jgi:hypothetical protein